MNLPQSAQTELNAIINCAQLIISFGEATRLMPKNILIMADIMSKCINYYSQATLFFII